MQFYTQNEVGSNFILCYWPAIKKSDSNVGVSAKEAILIYCCYFCYLSVLVLLEYKQHALTTNTVM